MNTIRKVEFAAAGVVLGLVQACGSSAPTPQLVEARRAYDQAQMSPGSKLTPDQLLRARQALDAAERAHKDDPGSAREAHLAYLADRKAQQATALGKIAEAKQSEQNAKNSYVSQLEKGSAQSRSELATERSAREKAEQERQAADQRAAAALQSLAQVAQVKNDERGTVLTIPGAVLFENAKSVLSSTARQKLDQVANALREQPPDSKIRIEGYTDARGSDSFNEQLSQSRAQAVRDYLVQQGLDANEIEAVGRGESNPIASNDTAEGRAENRRVEIVIPPRNERSSANNEGAPRPSGVTASSR